MPFWPEEIWIVMLSKVMIKDLLIKCKAVSKECNGWIQKDPYLLDKSPTCVVILPEEEVYLILGM